MRFLKLLSISFFVVLVGCNSDSPTKSTESDEAGESSALMSSSAESTNSSSDFSSGGVLSSSQLSSSSEAVSSSSNTEIFLLDSRDSREYKTVQLGTQVWMAENLKYLPQINRSNEGGWGEVESYYYVYRYEPAGESEILDLINAVYNSNYANDGVLYNWKAAMGGEEASENSQIQGACPDNWHLPSVQEWEILADFVEAENPDKSAGHLLKSTYGWENNGNGSDVYGFGARPGGYRYNASYMGQKEYGTYWTSDAYTEVRSNQAVFSFDDNRITIEQSDNTNGYSVRCVEN